MRPVCSYESAPFVCRFLFDYMSNNINHNNNHENELHTLFEVIKSKCYCHQLQILIKLGGRLDVSAQYTALSTHQYDIERGMNGSY